MKPGTAQGIAIHGEYKSAAACVVEIDCTAGTVNRKVKDGFTGPRVTKVTFAVDAGLPINPLGIEAQMLGGINDGIAQALTFSLHLATGTFPTQFPSTTTSPSDSRPIRQSRHCRSRRPTD